MPENSNNNNVFSINNFDLRPLELYNFFNQYVIKQKAAKQALANAICSHYKRLQYENTIPISDLEKIPKSNVLLIGPTGVGKTYLIELAAARIGIPYIRADATKYTEAGYVGGDVEDIIKDLSLNADEFRDAEQGIVYIDEIDKVARPNDFIGGDVSRGAVQEALLKLIEGTDIWVDCTQNNIDTKNILFVFSGAFDGLEEIMKKRVKSGMGFNADIHSRQQFKSRIEKGDIRPTLDDFVNYGFDKQFIGRIPNICFLEDLNKEDLYRILKLPKCPVVIGKQREFMGYGIELTFEEESFRTLASRAAQLKIGARGLKRVIDDALKDYQFILPSTDYSNVFGKLTITQEMLDAPKKCLTEMVKSVGGYKQKNKIRAIAGYQGIHGIKKRIPDMQVYMNKLRQEGIGSVFIGPAAKYGIKTKIPPSKINGIILNMFSSISSYERNFQQRFGPKLMFNKEARQSLVLGALEIGSDINNYIYNRIGRYIEIKRLWTKNSIPKLVIEQYALTDPKAYVSNLTGSK